jgi:hypothetical protein
MYAFLVLDVNSWHLSIKQAEMSHKGDETRTFKISYFVISEVLSYKTVKVIDIRVTFTGRSVM